MRLFGRKDADDPTQAVAEFWRWWTQEGAAKTALAIDERSLDTWAHTLSMRIEQVDEQLAWELGPGERSRHVLVVTAEGNPQLRATARRWRRAAPAADEMWSYSDVRLPTSGLGWTLTFDEQPLDAASVRVAAQRSETEIDVVLHHPAMSELAEPARDNAAFLLLDSALGEAAVETWIGTVASSAAPVDGGIDLEQLREMVDSLERSSISDDGERAWVALEGTGRGGMPMLALTQVPLRPMTAPHLDTHVRLELRFSQVLDNGLPGEQSLQALRQLEDHLQARLGDSGQVVAHETSAGTRVLHLYVDGTTPAPQQVRAALGSWQDSRPKVDVRADPAWDGVRHLRA